MTPTKQTIVEGQDCGRDVSMCLSRCVRRPVSLQIHHDWAHQRLLPGAQWGQIHRAPGEGLHLPPHPQGAREGKRQIQQDLVSLSVVVLHNVVKKCLMSFPLLHLSSWWRLASSSVWTPSSMSSLCFPSEWFWPSYDSSRCLAAASGEPHCPWQRRKSKTQRPASVICQC